MRGDCTDLKALVEIPPVLEDGRRREERTIRIGAGMILAAVFVAILSAPLVLMKDVLPGCVMLQVFDVPCLFCGGTRTFAALATLDFWGALRLNPLITLLTIAVLAITGFCLKDPKTIGVKVKWSLVWTLLGAGLLANWVYLILYLPR